MTAQRFVLGMALATFAGLGLASDARAQTNSVTWNAGYPAGGAGQVTVYGSYTTQNGYYASSANFTWTAASGGTPTGVTLDVSNNLGGPGNVGQRNANGFSSRVVSLPAGSYQGWLTVVFRQTGTPVGSQIVISTVVQFTVT
jgi:hypothetical protein